MNILTAIQRIGCRGCPVRNLALRYPPAPALTSPVDGKEVAQILIKNGVPANIIHQSDKSYHLVGLTELKGFLKWYSNLSGYRSDDYDCDDFSIDMKANVAQWSKGKILFGIIWAMSDIGSPKSFGSHAFNWTISVNKQLYFCDQLGVAVNKDSFIPAYKVQAFNVLF